MALGSSQLTQEQRARAVSNALESVRIEGLEPDDDAKVIFQRYVDGDLTLEQMGTAIDQLNDRNYGPVRLSGNERSSESSQPPRS